MLCLAVKINMKKCFVFLKKRETKRNLNKVSNEILEKCKCWNWFSFWVDCIYRMLSQSLASMEHSKDSDKTGTLFQTMSNLWKMIKNVKFQTSLKTSLDSYICRSGSLPSANTLTFLYSSLITAQCFCIKAKLKTSSGPYFISPFCLLWTFSSFTSVASKFVGSFSILFIKVSSALWATFADVIDEKRPFLMPPGVENVMLSIE